MLRLHQKFVCQRRYGIELLMEWGEQSSLESPLTQISSSFCDWLDCSKFIYWVPLRFNNE
jgi:hypothetical protein